MTSTTPTNRPDRPWRWAALLGLIALVGAVAWLFSSQGPALAEPPPQARERPRPTPEEAPRAQASSPRPPEAAPVQAPPEPAPPIVDEVLVEKQEVCSGEENLITVKAHTPDGNDAWLHYTVGTGTGMRVPIRVWAHDDGSYEIPTLTVFTRNNVSTTVPIPKFKVKQCEPERLIHVMSRRVPNSEDELEFFARLIEKPRGPGEPERKPFVPVKYVWTFDDEPQETTTTPLVTHALLSRLGAESLYTQHLVRVDVYDAAGRKETGRSSLQVLNTSFENFDKKGIVTILAVGTPRFPVLGEDGVVRQTFRLYHRFRGPIRLDKVTAIRAFNPRGDGPPPPEQVDPTTLPVSEIPEGKGTEVKVSLDTRAEPEVSTLTYSLEGTSADGHPARGTFSVMRPPPLPTRENSTKVTDPVLMAKIKRARELLNQPYVTDEDLWRLEREGRFADLKASPPQPASPTPPRHATERPERMQSNPRP